MQSFWFIFCTEPGGKWADMVSGQRWPDTLECSIVERLIEIAWRVTEAHQAITHTHCNYETIRVCRQQRWRGWVENTHRWMKSFLVTTVEVAAVDRLVAFVSNDSFFLWRHDGFKLKIQISNQAKGKKMEILKGDWSGLINHSWGQILYPNVNTLTAVPFSFTAPVNESI